MLVKNALVVVILQAQPELLLVPLDAFQLLLVPVQQLLLQLKEQIHQMNQSDFVSIVPETDIYLVPLSPLKMVVELVFVLFVVLWQIPQMFQLVILKPINQNLIGFALQSLNQMLLVVIEVELHTKLALSFSIVTLVKIVLVQTPESQTVVSNVQQVQTIVEDVFSMEKTMPMVNPEEMQTVVVNVLVQMEIGNVMMIKIANVNASQS
jgi:hypothetical protein